MLSGLFIQNLAVIEKVYIEFDNGMNVFTGETGAGKSIVIDAINAILGGRCSKELVRTGADKAVIVGSFRALPLPVRSMAEKNGIELEEDELVIQREISADGRTSARVCGRPVTVSMLRELGARLINIHGQHDNQILLSPEKHIDILDSFGELGSLRSEYRQTYQSWKRVRSELEEMNQDEAHKAQKLDMLAYQINEIEQAELEPGEDDELEAEARVIRNSARIIESLNEAHQLLDGEDEMAGASELLSNAASSLSFASEYYSDLSETAERLQGISYEVADLLTEIGSYVNNLEFDPARLELIEERLNEIYKLKQKYGGTIEEILQHLENNRSELEQLELSDVRQSELYAQQEQLHKKCVELARQLGGERKQAAVAFVRTVSSELQFLDMGGVTLEVRFTPCELFSRGSEQLEFLISTNVGEPPKPIAKIASGGELSRIMLAIKNALAEKDEIPTLIFDEVDTGVSGSAAQKIGLKLKQAAGCRQILCVTHLAQIAALADTHFRIQKSVQESRTFTEVLKLDGEGRSREVARIMSTGEVTPLMLENARDLIERGKSV